MTPPGLPYVAVERRLRGRMGAMAAGRVLVIGYFRTCRCGVAVGDFSIAWRSAPPDGYLELAALEGVRIFADRRLIGVLGRAMPELWPGGILSRGTPSLRLGLPELWLDFLDGPASLDRPMVT